MTRILLLLISILFLSSCRSYIQICETATTNTKYSDADSTWVFENDSVKLSYAFWANGGILSFSIYNKLDKPIYIDWRNSSYIRNNDKFNYWVDEEYSSSLSYYGSYYYKGPLIKPGFTISEGVQATASVTTKPERKTFIPPKAFWYRSQFYLWPEDIYRMDKSRITEKTEPRNDDLAKNTVVWEQNFSESNSPLKFRNYLAYSFSESSEDFSFVDNGFYLSSVRLVDYRHYRGKKIGFSNGVIIYEKPLKRKTSFYFKSDLVDLERN